MTDKKTAFVLSAHAANVVWRCSGGIALYAAMGYRVTVVCLSFGERGVSAKRWKRPGMTLQKVKAAKRAEAEEAAERLGFYSLIAFDLGDYPLQIDSAAKDQLTRIMRAVQPAFMLSHSQYDPYNTDHMLTTQVVLECRVTVQASGHNPIEQMLGAPLLYLFEPHQSKLLGWKPDMFLDITPVWERKRATIECMAGQEHQWKF